MDTGDGADRNGNGHHVPDPIDSQSNQAVPQGAPVEPSWKSVDESAGAPEPLVVVETPKPLKLKPKQRAFLKAYAKGWSITRSAKIAKVTRQTVWNWGHETDGEGNHTLLAQLFNAAMAEAQEEGADYVEDVANEVATMGWYEPKFDKNGNKCGKIWKYDSRILEMLLKARRPDKYRERHEVTGANGAPLNPAKVEHTIKYDFSGLDADEVNDLYRKLSRSRILPTAGN